MPTTNYTRTLWNRDAYGIPSETNLYGTHPVYIDHRGKNGTHGVFFLNSNGMDIKIDKTEDGKQYLEYNAVGGVLDFYFLAGPTPKEVSIQYSEVVGLPAMQSYWTFGVSGLESLLQAWAFSESIDADCTLVPQLPIWLPRRLRSRRGRLQL